MVIKVDKSVPFNTSMNRNAFLHIQTCMIFLMKFELF